MNLSPPSTEIQRAVTAVAVPALAASAFEPRTSATTSPASPVTTCLSCWGFGTASVESGFITAVNHLFNSAFDWLSSFPTNPVSDFLAGALVLVRRALAFVPTGVTATQTGTELTVAVNTGSVAYFRTQGDTIEVAGDPGFSAAQRFAVSSVSQVSAANPGNAGCAGFAVTDGTTTAGLTTTGIDSLRFGTGAEFTGAVRSTTSGVLTLTGGVRGLSGVSLEAPVLLAGDVEVDAGDGDATFTGTVDGTGFFGGQSLLVTALGTTIFAAAVGGRTPLGSLTTRGIAPLQITQSADSRTVPLYFMPVVTGTGTSIENKYGIDVAIGDNPARRYLFDTGGNGFFAAYTPGYWDGVPIGSDPVDITYSSGGYLDGFATPATITIGTGSQTVSTTEQVLVSAVTTSADFFTSGPGQPTNPSAYDGPFAGDFGAAFGTQPIAGKSLYAPGSFITSPLFQLPGNLSSGYLVQLGPVGSTPSLTVGITPELQAQFPYAIPISVLSEPNTQPGYYPTTNYPLLQQFGIYPTYKVTDPTKNPPEVVDLYGAQPLQTLIDSGAASTNLRLPGDQSNRPFENGAGNLTPGTIFTATFPTAPDRTALTWQFIAGDNGSVNQVVYTDGTGAATSSPNVNTGLNLLNDFDVMYDVRDRIIWLRPNGGQAGVSLQSVTTRGAQSYGQNAVLNGTYTSGHGGLSVAGVTTLSADTVLDTGRGDVTFSGTVDAAGNPASLQVNSRGSTTFIRPVGGLRALSGLTTDPGGTTTSTGVATTGAQTYGDDVSLAGSYSAGAAFSAGRTTTLVGPTTVAATGGSAITFGDRLDSAPGYGYQLTVAGGPVTFNGAIGSRNPLGGITIAAEITATALGAITLNGGLNLAAATGLSIGQGATATFSQGGSISDFTGSGIVFEGNSPSSRIQGFTVADNVYDGILLRGTVYTGTLIAGNTIIGNSGFGIETLQGATGLAIRDNTIGAVGTTNQWGYVSGGPNIHGIVLGAGSYTGSVIAGNTITDNRRSGITAPGGVQGLQIAGNTLQNNGLDGITFADGDFTGTTITGNVIGSNGNDGISLAAGVGQGTTSGGNPLDGYAAALGHYELTYSNSPVFDDPKIIPPDPQVRVTVNDTTLPVNVDTGSRGLYFAETLLPGIDLTGSTPGYVYLNSSNRLFYGQWVTTDVVFPDSQYVDVGGADPTRTATARIPVLVVTAVGASTTPAPGTSTASTTFSTLAASGSVTITDGTTTEQVAIIANPAAGPEAGFVTIPGGWWATYSANAQPDGKPILGAVSNFGVGFDRTGVGTSPTANGDNQAYNAFLNLTEMRDGSMRAGYILSTGGVQLGLDNSVRDYAYTDLAPTGLAKGDQAPPDWQPATGKVTITPPATASDPNPAAQQYNTGPLVIDLGIPTGILTLPGQSPQTTFSGSMTVDLLNSGETGTVRYTIDSTTTDTGNLLNPNTQQSLDSGNTTTIAYFNPLAGAYTQNMPLLSQQFFNTGRRVLAAFNYLYDATGGYLGLAVSDQRALDSANGTFDLNHYLNPNLPAGVRNLFIQGNTITTNGGSGVAVNGGQSSADAILSNSISGNASGKGIALTNGANGSQPTPVLTSAVLSGSSITVTGRVAGSGPFQVQVFSNPASDAGNVQGRILLGTVNASAGSFTAQLPSGGAVPGNLITVTATPVIGALNTSEFSGAAPLAR